MKICSTSLIIQSSSVTQSCPTLCDPMNHSTPGLPVHHQLQKCKLKLPWGVTSHQSKRPSPKNIHIINVEEDVKKKLSYTVFWYYKLMQPVWETIWRFLKKLRIELPSVQFSCSAMSDSVTPWTAAHQASLSISNSPEPSQTHVHWVSDAIQPSHSLSSSWEHNFNIKILKFISVAFRNIILEYYYLKCVDFIESVWCETSDYILKYVFKKTSPQRSSVNSTR